MNDKYSEPAVKKQRISHYQSRIAHHDNVDSLRLTNYESSRDFSSFANSRSRESDDYFG
jgi:hypothetical protein